VKGKWDQEIKTVYRLPASIVKHEPKKIGYGAYTSEEVKEGEMRRENFGTTYTWFALRGKTARDH